MFAIIDIEYGIPYISVVSTEGMPLMLPAERFARVWIVALLVVFTAYFGVVSVLASEQIELSLLQRIGLLALALGSLEIIAGGTSAWLRLRRDETEAPDERDLQIDRRATQTAYYVLMGGLIYTGCVLPFSAKDKWEIVHAALFFIAVAEIVHASLVIRYYRRGLRA